MELGNAQVLSRRPHKYSWVRGSVQYAQCLISNLLPRPRKRTVRSTESPSETQIGLDHPHDLTLAGKAQVRTHSETLVPASAMIEPPI